MLRSAQVEFCQPVRIRVTEAQYYHECELRETINNLISFHEMHIAEEQFLIHNKTEGESK